MREPSYPVVYRIGTTDMASDLGFRAVITRTQLDAVIFRGVAALPWLSRDSFVRGTNGNAGSSSKLIPTKGATYEASDGTVGEIRSFHELDRGRLT